MNAPLVGIFSNRPLAARAISDLRSEGFDENAIAELLPEALATATERRVPQPNPSFELLKAGVVGAAAGGIVGILADWYLGLSLAWPRFGYTNSVLAAIFTMAMPGAIAGVLVALGIIGKAVAARRAMAAHYRQDSVVMVFASPARGDRALDILRGAGADVVHRGLAHMEPAGSTEDEATDRTYEVVDPPPAVHEGMLAPQPTDK